MSIKNYLKGAVGALLERAGGPPPQKAAIFSQWKVECFGEDGTLKWVEDIHNMVVTEGLNDILDTYFVNGTKITPWYVAIFNNDYAVLTSNTYAAKGFIESTAYDEATRPVWTPGAVSGASVDNSASKATFTISASETIYGAALVGGTDAATKNNSTAGAANVLYCSAQFSAPKAVVDNDVLKVTVTLTSSSV